MSIYKDIYRGVLYDLQGNALPGPSTGPVPLVGFNTYLDNLDPGYNLEFGDAAAACVDSSSAGNDFTITGGSYSRNAAGASAMFSGLGAGYVDSVTALCKSDADGIASSGGFTIGFVWLVESNPSNNFRFFDNQDTGAPTVGRTLFYQTPSGLAGMHGTTVRQTSRLISGTLHEAMWCFGVNAAGDEAYFYENGVKFAQTAWKGSAADLQTGAGWTTAILDNAGSTVAPAYGKHYAHFQQNAAMTDTQVYQAFKEATEGQVHRFKEVIEPSHTAGLVWHFPLWEKGSTMSQAIDLSGNENHGSYASLSTKGSAPIGSDSMYAVTFNGSSSSIDTVADYDITSQDFSFECRIVPDAPASGDAILGFGSGTSDYVALYIDSSGYLTLEVYDGSLTVSAQYGVDVRTVATHVGMTWDASEQTGVLYVNGEIVGAAEASALSLTGSGSSSAGNLGESPRSGSRYDGTMDCASLWNILKSPADMQALTTLTA